MNTRNIFIGMTISIVLCGPLMGTDASADSEWPYYGGTQWNERHVMFTEINKRTVAHLVPPKDY